MQWKNLHGQVKIHQITNSINKNFFLVVHGSLSTILGVTVLAFINSYMVLVFFKTIFLVLVIGVFHALVLLPIILHDTAPFTDRFNNYLDEKEKKKNEARQSNDLSIRNP